MRSGDWLAWVNMKGETRVPLVTTRLPSMASALTGRRARTAGLAASLALVLLMTFVVRYVSLEAVEIGGDALRVWEFGRRLAFGVPLPSKLDHHQARFGLVLPTFVLQKLVGTRAVHYYAGPLVMGAVLHATVFFIGLRLSGPLAASVAVLWLWLFPEMVRPSSQLLPELYGPTYTMLAVACALAYASATTPRGRWFALVGTGVALFFAYGSKLSYLYFAPGCAGLFLFGRPKATVTPLEKAAPRSSIRRAIAWAERKRLLDAGLLALFVVALIGCETVLYRLLTEQQSQLAVVERTHGISKSVVKSASDLFAIYRYAGPAWDRALATGGCALIVLLALARDRLARLFALLSVVYLLLFTFVLRKWSPPTPWAEPHPRYLLAIAPCIAVVIGISVEQLARLPSRWVEESRRALTVQVISCILAAGLLAFGVYEPVRKLVGGLPSSHAISRTERLSRDMTRAYERNVPLVTTTKPPKPLIAAASLFIEPSALVHEGKLPTPNELIRNARARDKRPLYYLTPELLTHFDQRSALGAVVATRHKESRCIVSMTQRARFFRMNPKRTNRCEPLLDEWAERATR